jgi:hypothetical protein
MNNSPGAVPPRVLQRTLHKITESLAAELAHPTPAEPDWSEFEWTIARAVAAMHGVSALLSRALLWPGPEGWKHFVEEQRAHTAKRYERIAELLQRLDRQMQEAGVAVTALKGAALHAMGLYAAGERPMADIDLLVRPAQTERAASILESLGLHESSVSWKERVFSPQQDRGPADLGEHANNSIKIELHTRICEKLPWRITDASELIFPRQPQPGLNPYPSKASLMLHLLLHAAGSMTTRALRLLHLHDLARLSSLMTELDWQELLAQNSRDLRLWWAFPPLKLVSRYYPAAIPVRVLTALAGECPLLLKSIATSRVLYDVSYSYPWVNAFPGIEWSQSLGEMLEYAASRVKPDAGHVASREHNVKTQAWALQSSWERLSQGRRMVRWITSRPTRAPTMHAVRAALAQTR